MDRKIDIHKAGGVLIKDGKFLVARSKEKEFFIAPGGSIEDGETSKQALIRELKEELKISVNESSLEEFGTFFAPAAGQEEKFLQMDVFLVTSWNGELIPSNEIEEILWIDSNPPENIKIGSIFQHEVLPRLKDKGLIT